MSAAPTVINAPAHLLASSTVGPSMTLVADRRDGGVAITEAEFDAYLAQHKRRLFAVAYGVLRDRGEAEDAVQETMWRAWRKWDTVREEDKRDAWLTRICLNHCFRRRERLQRVEVREVTDQTDRTGREQVLRDPDLDRAFRRLPTKQRAAVLLHYHYGYGVEQTAELMGCRPGTARTHIQRALASLRRELGTKEVGND